MSKPGVIFGYCYLVYSQLSSTADRYAYMLKDMSEEKRVLIVEDEIEMRNLLSDRLKKEGFVPDAAGTVHEALAKCKSQKYVAIVSDFRIPGESGIGFAVKLKLLYDPVPPIFIITGDTELSEAAVKSAGITKLFIKPFRLEELIKAVHMALKKSS